MGNSGLKTWMPGESSITTVPTGENSCREIRISGDGQVIVVSNAAYKMSVSIDGGNSFEDISSATNPASSTFDASHVPYGGGQTRLELAISKETK